MGDQPFGSTILLAGDLRSKYNPTMPNIGKLYTQAMQWLDSGAREKLELHEKPSSAAGDEIYCVFKEMPFR